MTLEIIRLIRGQGRPRVAVFDFDGTVSLLRSGWQQVMIDLAVEAIPRLRGEQAGDIAKLAHDLVYRTNGIPTLFQMEAISEMVQARGGSGLDAEGYKRLFLERLAQRVQPRMMSIQSKSASPEAWRVPGVEGMLGALAKCHIPCYLASGTDETAVIAEAAALGLDGFFAGIFGATSNPEKSRKAAVFEGIVTEHNLGPDELVTFGDGVEEIRLTRSAAGIAIGIARDESNPGKIDPDQRARLVAAGADAITVDFIDSKSLMGYLFEGVG